ncbi:unnamed protein product [Triticum turgidum subsp. durum]|uniref:F-box protein AT5G49610-like beta-propeller domain-containing protein n=1 Tax=Triticum turgidum subsp. durum TaxID=4567 RepID=A0A9R1AFA5_TRITD|nr:unnamed protein product [Triticum turgidum subsp. durum]
MDIDLRRHCPTSMVAVVSKVLDDDDLLAEILLHVVFPTTLVRAALESKRWYHHASDRQFLRRFRKLHPPCLLGFYVVFMGARFIPMQSQLPELASIIRHVPSYSSCYWIDFKDCRNGIILTRDRKQGVLTYKMDSPLCPKRGMPIVPLPPSTQGPVHIFSEILSKEEGDGLSYFYLLVELTKEKKIMVHVYMLQDGVWCILTSATNQLHYYPLRRPNPVLVDNKIYMGASNNIPVLDLSASTFSAIHLPQGVEYASSEIQLSRTDDASGVYLIHLRPKEFQLCVWLHKEENWLLLDTIYLYEMRAISGKIDRLYVHIRQVGDNAQFVFLQISQYVFYLDIKCRTLRKVYEMTVDEQSYVDIHPFMMIWPPIFPALKDDPARNAI